MTPEIITTPPVPVQNQGGRPTSYDPAYCDQILAFFRSHQLETTRTVVTETDSADAAKRSRKTETRDACGRMPTFEGFAVGIGTSTQTLRNWAARDPEFACAVYLCKDMQKDWLVQNGASGFIPAQSLIFLATNLTNMVNKTETAVSVETPREIAAASPERLVEARRRLEEARNLLLAPHKP